MIKIKAIIPDSLEGAIKEEFLKKRLAIIRGLRYVIFDAEDAKSALKEQTLRLKRTVNSILIAKIDEKSKWYHIVHSVIKKSVRYIDIKDDNLSTIKLKFSAKHNNKIKELQKFIEKSWTGYGKISSIQQGKNGKNFIITFEFKN